MKTRIAKTRLVGVVHGDRVAEGVTITSDYERPSSPDIARKVFHTLLKNEAVETFIVLGVDVRHKPIAHWVVGVGTLSGCSVDPRNVFGTALRLGTVSAVLLAHNHPSGDSTPSAADLAVTRRLIECGKLLGIPVLDHIVIAGVSWASMRQLGVCNFA